MIVLTKNIIVYNFDRLTWKRRFGSAEAAAAKKGS